MRKDIIIIDDDRDLCTLLQESLLQENICADISCNGFDGIKSVKDKEYQLVVLDVMMPGISGFEVLERIRDMSNVPILMLTAKDDSTSKVKGLRAGADDYLTKQFKIAKSKKVKELSKGMQMKLMLACAFSYDSKLLILDEPTSGLDPVSRDELLEIIEKYVEDGKHSVLFSTHITSDLEKVADYITYINYGELIYSGEKKKLLEEFYVIRNVREEIPIGIREKLIGVRKTKDGVQALLKKEYIKEISGLGRIEKATLDDIVVFTSKGE